MVAEIGLGELLWTLLVLDLIHDLSGAREAAWFVALLFIPVITVVVYLVARGDGIGERRLTRTGTPPPPPPAALA